MRNILWDLHRLALGNMAKIVSFPDYNCKLGLYPGEHVSDSIWKGTFEKDVCGFVCRFLKPNMTFFDIGANLGLYTVIAGKILNGTGKVHSFEPSQREFDRLAYNVRINDLNNVKINHLAISDRDGMVELNVCDDIRAAYNSIGVVTHTEAEGFVCRKENVASTTIDSYVLSEKIKKVNLIKIDVEGAESLVLRGAAKLLEIEYAPVLICEFNDNTARGLESTSEELWNILTEYGYSLYELVSPYGTVLQRSVKKPRYSSLNLVALRSPPVLDSKVFTVC